MSGISIFLFSIFFAPNHHQTFYFIFSYIYYNSYLLLCIIIIFINSIYTIQEYVDLYLIYNIYMEHRKTLEKNRHHTHRFFLLLSQLSSRIIMKECVFPLKYHYFWWYTYKCIFKVSVSTFSSSSYFIFILFFLEKNTRFLIFIILFGLFMHVLLCNTQ